jgi:hypothetical protein
MINILFSWSSFSSCSLSKKIYPPFGVIHFKLTLKHPDVIKWHANGDTCYPWVADSIRYECNFAVPAQKPFHQHLSNTKFYHMKILIPILVSGIVATIAMTAFSYILSFIVKKNFKEPLLLNILMDRVSKNKNEIIRKHIAGWLIHFGVGILFVLLFKIFASIFDLPLSMPTAIIYGTIAGINGVASWSILLRLHPFPPAIDRLLFYCQLVIAHVIFGIVMVTILRQF